ncbi:MAG: hypothetical protein AABZ84_10240 [Pseudomonadota bacterium]
MLRKIVSVILMITLTSLSLHAVAAVGVHAQPASTAVDTAPAGEYAAAHHHEQLTVAADKSSLSSHDDGCAAGGHCCLAIPTTLLPPLAKHHPIYVAVWHVLPVAADSAVHIRPPIASL